LQILASIFTSSAQSGHFFMLPEDKAFASTFACPAGTTSVIIKPIKGDRINAIKKNPMPERPLELANTPTKMAKISQTTMIKIISPKILKKQSV
jgi:hypothetical protein